MYKSKIFPTDHLPNDIFNLAKIVDEKGLFVITKSYQCLLYINSYSKDLSDWLQSKFGGKIFTYLSHHKKPYFSWCVSGKNLDHIFETIRFFLNEKKDMFDVACEIRKTFSKEGKLSLTGKEILEKREMCYQKMKELKLWSREKKYAEFPD